MNGQYQGNSASSSSGGGDGHPQVRITLQEAELWDKFKALTNEMIVTKGGRRMFPVIKTKVEGLVATDFYAVELEFRQIEDNRWKYINGEWLAGEFHYFFPDKMQRKVKPLKLKRKDVFVAFRPSLQR